MARHLCRGRAGCDLVQGVVGLDLQRRAQGCLGAFAVAHQKGDVGAILVDEGVARRQPFRFVVLRDSETARAAKQLLGNAARQAWGTKRERDGYDKGSGATENSPKARMAASMEHYVANFERAPVVVLSLLQRYRAPTPSEGGSVYPACQNLLLAARALGYGVVGRRARVDEGEQIARDRLGARLLGTFRRACGRARRHGGKHSSPAAHLPDLDTPSSRGRSKQPRLQTLARAV